MAKPVIKIESPFQQSIIQKLYPNWVGLTSYWLLLFFIISFIFQFSSNLRWVIAISQLKTLIWIILVLQEWTGWTTSLTTVTTLQVRANQKITSYLWTLSWLRALQSCIDTTDWYPMIVPTLQLMWEILDHTWLEDGLD